MDLLEELQVYLQTDPSLRGVLSDTITRTINNAELNQLIEGFNYLARNHLWTDTLKDIFSSVLHKRIKEGFFFFYRTKRGELYSILSYDENQELYDYEGNALDPTQLDWMLSIKDFDDATGDQIQDLIGKSRGRFSFLMDTDESILMGIMAYEDREFPLPQDSSAQTAKAAKLPQDSSAVAKAVEVHFFDPSDDPQEQWVEALPIVNTFDYLDRYLTLLTLLHDNGGHTAIEFQQRPDVYNYTQL